MEFEILSVFKKSWQMDLSYYRFFTDLTQYEVYKAMLSAHSNILLSFMDDLALFVLWNIYVKVYVSLKNFV